MGIILNKKLLVFKMFNKYVMIIETLILTAAISLVSLTLPKALPGEEAGIILRTGEITDISGEVEIKKTGKDFWTKASVGLMLSQYDMIRTGEGARADIEFSEKDGKYFKLRLLDESRLGFSKLEYDEKTTIEDILLDLAIGDVLIKTDKFAPRSKFKVRTPTSMIGVRGTRFEVRYETALKQL